MNYSEKSAQNATNLSDRFDEVLYKLHAVSMMNLDGVSKEVSIGHYYLLQDVIGQIEQLKFFILPLEQKEAEND